MHTCDQFTTLSDVRDHDIAFETGIAGGMWTKCNGQAESNGGTIVRIDATSYWQRQCDPSRLDARWFGAQADGEHDDAAAIQRAIDALPPSGGQVVLPSGRMLCKKSLKITRSYVSLIGSNCGLLSKYFEPGAQIGSGSLLYFQECDGIIIQPPAQTGEARPPRLGGITMRDIGIAGTGRQDGQRGIVVNKGERWRWGSTDGLLLDRVYCIDLTWSGDFTNCDMSVFTSCWFSECGNGIKLTGCVYNCVTNCCFADNDGTGVLVIGGHGSELTSNVFVRNEHGLVLDSTKQLRVIGGTFETDGTGGERDDKTFICAKASDAIAVTGAHFSCRNAAITKAVEQDMSSVTLTGCIISEEL